MPGKVAKIGTFSDWIGLFNDWRKDIGVNTADIDAFHFDTLYGAIDTEEIEFGSYKGRRKWENLRQMLEPYLENGTLPQASRALTDSAVSSSGFSTASTD